MIQPLDQFVVVELPEEVLQKQHGILITVEKTKGKTLEGTAIAVGAGKKLNDDSIREMSVKVGDKVMIPMDAGVSTKLNEKRCVILKEDDVIAVIEN